MFGVGGGPALFTPIYIVFFPCADWLYVVDLRLKTEMPLEIVYEDEIYFTNPIAFLKII